MKDSIYYGNILGLLKMGKWSLNLNESSALVQLAEETQRRLNPPEIKPKEEPIKTPKVKRGNK